MNRKLSLALLGLLLIGLLIFFLFFGRQNRALVDQSGESAASFIERAYTFKLPAKEDWLKTIEPLIFGQPETVSELFRLEDEPGEEVTGEIRTRVLALRLEKSAKNRATWLVRAEQETNIESLEKETIKLDYRIELIRKDNRWLVSFLEPIEPIESERSEPEAQNIPFDLAPAPDPLVLPDASPTSLIYFDYGGSAGPGFYALEQSGQPIKISLKLSQPPNRIVWSPDHQRAFLQVVFDAQRERALGSPYWRPGTRDGQVLNFIFERSLDRLTPLDSRLDQAIWSTDSQSLWYTKPISPSRTSLIRYDSSTGVSAAWGALEQSHWELIGFSSQNHLLMTLPRPDGLAQLVQLKLQPGPELQIVRSGIGLDRPMLAPDGRRVLVSSPKNDPAQPSESRIIDLAQPDQRYDWVVDRVPLFQGWWISPDRFITASHQDPDNLDLLDIFLWDVSKKTKQLIASAPGLIGPIEGIFYSNGTVYLYHNNFLRAVPILTKL